MFRPLQEATFLFSEAVFRKKKIQSIIKEENSKTPEPLLAGTIGHLW
jgi:hypothetical protein